MPDSIFMLSLLQELVTGFHLKEKQSSLGLVFNRADLKLAKEQHFSTGRWGAQK